MQFSASELILIPVISGLVGWSTNWLAVWMTFYPLAYRGIWPFGWQGIIPSRAERMARIVASRGVQRVGKLEEFLDQMDREELRNHLALTAREGLEESIEAIMRRAAPGMWPALPPAARLAAQARVHTLLTDQAEGLFASIRGNISELITIEDIAVVATQGDPTLVNRIFQRAGEVEFRLIIRAGLWMGLLLGLLIALLWRWFPLWWVLPVGGLALGLVTNWWALTIIFQPLYPVKIGPFRVQGIFLKRQREVSEVWAGIIAREVLTLPNVLKALLSTNRAEFIKSRFVRRVAEQICAQLERDRPLWQDFAPDLDTRRVGMAGAAHIIQLLVTATEHQQLPAVSNTETARIITDRMVSMAPEDFQDVLRPAFQEEEWKLIAVGAVLGCLAGVGQLLLFGG